MLRFNRRRKENSKSQPSDNPQYAPNRGLLEDQGIVVDRSMMQPSPIGTNSYAISDDLAPSELSSSAYDQYPNQMEEGIQSFEDSIAGASGAADPETQGKNDVPNNNNLQPQRPDPDGSVHAISYVTQELAHGYSAENEDDLSTLGDESIIRRGRWKQELQQKEQERKKQELKKQKQKEKQQQKQKQQKKRGKPKTKKVFDTTKISKAHTRSTEEVSPSSAASRDLSFSFSNVLDVNEKIPDSSILGHDITDDSMTDKDREGKIDGDPDFDDTKKDEPFYERHKWTIIKFIIGISLFLLFFSATVLVVSLLRMRRIASSSNEATFIETRTDASDEADNSMPSFLDPIDLMPAAEPTRTSPPISFPTSSPPPLETSDNVVATTVSTAAPIEDLETEVETQPPTEEGTERDFATFTEPPTGSIIDSPPTIEPNTTAATTGNATLPGSGSGNVVNTIDDAEQSKVADDLRFVIGSFSPESEPSLQDPESAQSKAFTWVTQDPNYWDYGVFTIVQRWTLAVLYYSTNGPTWKTELLPKVYAEGKSPWLSYSDECLWESSNEGNQGIVCDSENNYFAIHLREIGVTGSLPPELGLLSDHLRLIFFNGNELTGTLPSELGQLTNLQKINFQYNNLSGSLSTEFGRWTDLSIIAAGNNAFTGTIPTETGLWESMKTIGFESNNFFGNLPKEWGNLENIEKISVEQNFLYGKIPKEYNDMVKLTSLSLQSNDLTGDTPWGLCPGCYSVEQLKADCDEIKCDCCTECF